jgi:hypothetical protein
MRRSLQIVFCLLSVAVLVLAAIWNYGELTDAFGQDGPYNGGTENMDKWQNTLPILVLVDAFVLVGVGAVMRKVLRTKAMP